MQTQANLGWVGPDPIDVRVTNRTGGSVAVGDIVLLDHARDAAASTGNEVGSSAAGLANIIHGGSIDAGAAFNTATSHGIWGCVLKAATQSSATTIRLVGKVDALRVGAAVVLKTANLTGSATPLVADVATTVDVTSVTTARPRKVIAIALTSTLGADVTDGWMNGVSGFGSVLAA